MKSTKRILAALLSALMALGVLALGANAAPYVHSPVGVNSFIPSDCENWFLGVYGPGGETYELTDFFVEKPDGTAISFVVHGLQYDALYALRIGYEFLYYTSEKDVRVTLWTFPAGNASNQFRTYAPPSIPEPDPEPEPETQPAPQTWWERLSPFVQTLLRILAFGWLWM